MRLIILTFLGILIANLENNGVVFGSKSTSSQEDGKAELSESLPNFLILFADDLGYGDLAGTFGHPTSSTSNLKSLGAASKVFTNFYVTSPVCSPSRYKYSNYYFSSFNSNSISDLLNIPYHVLTYIFYIEHHC